MNINSTENNQEEIPVILGIWLYFGNFLGSTLVSPIAHFHWNSFPAEIIILYITLRNSTLCLFLFTAAVLAMVSVIRLQGTTTDHQIKPPVQTGGNCKVRSNCWELFQVLKISMIKMMRALTTIPRLFCPPNSFYTPFLSTFSPTAREETKLYCHLSVFQLHSRGLHLLQYLQNPTCQLLPSSFSAVTCPHKLFFFQFLSVFVLFKPGTFPSFLSVFICEAPKIPAWATAAQHHLNVAVQSEQLTGGIRPSAKL